MTARDVFWQAYQRTLTATGSALDEAHVEECWRAVQAFQASLFDSAASLLCSELRWLPKAAEWREACERAAADEERRQLQARDDEWQREASRPNLYRCPDCRDTGFIERLCTDSSWCSACKIHRRHLYDHPVVSPCACRPTNLVYQEARRRATVQGAPDAHARTPRRRGDFEHVGSAA